MRRSCQTITANALLAWSEKQVAYAKQRYSAAPGRGVTNLEALSHDVACAETVRRMLKQIAPGQQTNFKQLFEKVRK